MKTKPALRVVMCGMIAHVSTGLPANVNATIDADNDRLTGAVFAPARKEGKFVPGSAHNPNYIVDLAAIPVGTKVAMTGALEFPGKKSAKQAGQSETHLQLVAAPQPLAYPR